MQTIFNIGSIRVERLRILVQKLRLADSRVRISHFVVDSTSSDLGSLSAVVRHGLLLLAHLIVVSHSVHLSIFFTI